MLKILVVSHSYVVAENRKNISALQKLCRVCVVVPDKIRDTIFDSHRTESNSETYQVRRRISLPRSQYMLASWSLGMRQFKPDIIHIEYDPWSVIFWQTCLCRMVFARNAKIVCTVKKNTYRKIRQPLEFIKNRIARFFIRRVDHFLAVNRGVVQIYSKTFGVADSRITVLQHLGVDTDKFYPANEETVADPNTIVVGFCGRLDQNKGLRELVDAVSRIRSKATESSDFPDLKLRLLGNGELRCELKAMDQPWIEVLDPVPHSEVPDFMRQLDVFVLPSQITTDHEEHDGHALIEALACGLPCIGSTSGVISELLANECGIVFPAGDVDALQIVLERIIRDSGNRKQLKLSAVKSASNLYSVLSIARQKAEIFARIGT